MDILIIYYIFINESNNWKTIVTGQLIDICELLKISKLYCIICAEKIQLVNECKCLLPPNCEVDHVLVNNFEYPGLKTLHHLGNMYPDKLLFYMHTKGMVYNNNNGRIGSEIKILRESIKNWEYILYIFEKYKVIDKCGLFPDHTGMIWYNFFWIRGSFLQTLKSPEISNDRYYYEHYIKNNISQNGNCFNLLTFDTTTIDQTFAIIKNISINHFNYKKYITKYQDLKNLNKHKAYIHFLYYGIKERRDLL